METKRNIQLTSAEISALFQSYINDSMSICVFKYMQEITEDSEIKTVIEHALDLAQQHVEIVRKIFIDENIPVPYGFTEQDVNVNAERLFSDTFCLDYVKQMAKGGLIAIGTLLPQIFRDDIRSFYSKCLTSSIELDNEAAYLLLEKGLAIRPPVIPYPKKNEFIHRQSFLAGFFEDKRSLTSMECTILYSNIQTNKLGEALAIAFSQVAKSKKVREFMLRGKEIAEKHINIFGSALRKENLPSPMTWDQGITEGKEAPFSDKLMMYHFGLMTYSGIGNYGMAISASQRSDLVTSFSRLLVEVVKYAEDGVNIMIDEEWLEQPPLAADRDELAKG
ncbi:DUF3231 family protein [Priestia megaterium]|uniref:DUF3231 family protein n=1 Tax=Priestia megaterium TaxID=1404 RepID=UPI0036D925D0